jgi:RNA polymerase sigma factor (sigma-70 family)
MTAVPEWEVVGPTDTDADLVRASLTGDRTAFGQMYDRYADRLHDYCIGMLHDPDGAADCVQDCFCVAATRLSQLRDPDKLRPWLYSIARNEALRRIRDRRRVQPSDELPDTAASDPDMDTLAARTELSDLIADAAGGLSDRDRSVLELAFRHGLNGPDLADALGVTPGTANTIVRRLRETIERTLGALLVARRVRNSGGCPELAAMLDGWDETFNVLIRKRISRHIESCVTCDDQRRELVSPAALLGAAPAFIPAPTWLREQTLSEVQLTSHGSATDGEADDAAGAHFDDAGAFDSDGAKALRRRRMVLVAALLIAVLGAAFGLTFAWLPRAPVSILPTDISGSAPESTGQVPIPDKAPPTQTGVQVQTTDPAAIVQPPPDVQILVPVTPPVDDAPPEPGSEPTPEQIPPVPPPSSDSQKPRLTPSETRPTRTATPRAPASQSPKRGTINNPAPPGDDDSAPGGRGGSNPGSDGGSSSGRGGSNPGSDGGSSSGRGR